MQASDSEGARRYPAAGLGLLLERVAHSLSRDAATVLAPHDLSSLHLGLLSALSRHGPSNQSRLAGYLGVERQQMVNIVNRLQSLQLVERQAVPGDRRSWSIRLTETGATRLRQAEQAARRHDHRVFAVLDDDEQAELASFLLRLIPQGRFPDLFAAPGSDAVGHHPASMVDVQAGKEGKQPANRQSAAPDRI